MPDFFDIASELNKRTKKHWKRITASSLITVATTALDLVSPYLFFQAVDIINEDSDESKDELVGMGIILGFATAWTVKSFLSSVRERVVAPIGIDAGRSFTVDIMRKHYKYALEDRSVRTDSREVNQFSAAQRRVSPGIQAFYNVAIPAEMTSLATAVFMTLHYPEVGGIIFGMTSLHLSSLIIGSKWAISRPQDFFTGKLIDAYAWVIDALIQCNSTIYNRAVERQNDVFKSNLKVLNQTEVQYVNAQKTVQFISDLIAGIGFVFSTGYVATSEGDTQAFIWNTFYVLNIVIAMRELGKVQSTLLYAYKDIARLIEHLAEAEEHNLGNLDFPSPNSEAPAVTFQNVTFAYKLGDGRKVLDNVSFSIDSGITIVSGPSGVGKSTVLNLIFGYLKCDTSGAVRIYGVDINTLNKDSLRDNIAVVPQEPQLFDDSIFENIRYAKPNATDSEVNTAVKQAGLEKVVQELGADSSALSLSVGQKRRLAIARALLRNTPIILLDEPTVGLDPHSKSIMLSHLNRITHDQKKTVVMVTHDPISVLALSATNQVIMLRDGMVEEVGDPKVLMSKNGAFSRQLSALRSQTKPGFFDSADFTEEEKIVPTLRKRSASEYLHGTDNLDSESDSHSLSINGLPLAKMTFS